MTYWAELVELYEYKVADALAGRVPRGGRRSLTELRDLLLAAPLEPALMRRLMECDRQYRVILRSSRADLPESRPAATGVPAWEAPASSNTPEARAWEELQRLAWHSRLQASLLELTQLWSREPDRTTLRVLYTVLENAEREGRTHQARLSVPAAGDPLVSLRDAEVVGRLSDGLAALLLQDEGRQRLRAALSGAHEQPFARHPDEDVLAARIAAIERDHLSVEERSRLIAALRTQYPEARDPRERPAIREAVRGLQRTIEELMAGAPAVTLGVGSSHQILYARSPQSALPAPDDGRDELVIHLEGGQAAHWRGQEIRWQPIGLNWQVQIGTAVALLRPESPLTERSVLLGPPRQQFRVFISGPYALLKVEGRPEEEIGRLASRARAIALLLESDDQYANLRLARATAQQLRSGKVDLEALGPESAVKYQSAPPEALVAFARKGVEALLQRLQHYAPGLVATVIEDCARLLQIDGGLNTGRVTRLHEALHIAAFTPEVLSAPVSTTLVHLPDNGRFVSILLGQDPVTLHSGERALTLRMDYKGELAALLPGHPAVLLRELLVIRVPGQSLLLVRQGTWLAVASLHDPFPASSTSHGSRTTRSTSSDLSRTLGAATRTTQAERSTDRTAENWPETPTVRRDPPN